MLSQLDEIAIANKFTGNAYWMDTHSTKLLNTRFDMAIQSECWKTGLFLFKVGALGGPRGAARVSTSMVSFGEKKSHGCRLSRLRSIASDIIRFFFGDTKDLSEHSQNMFSQ